MDALIEENGPFRLDPAGNVLDRETSWSNVSNVLFFEQPLNVGFSFSTDPADNNMDDPTATANTVKFIQAFLESFPDLKGRDLWLTGES
mmetsp:Transcript_102570/g.221345  ORF Transcript_102570/g.221345 Transcript_102570/m.221345 type:complete len:89 (-) Transcript_102570:1007-1273(-)|eukprot:CAMPEP_0116908326 /NCGR_PEP_ID=MMETSP0467-20121206/13626_1 /TAXON_ID=283647 /ORGANISM="Mesodinium pulex, Strain SPMC105" /LENGTH=88 /DNA_ID=CAMNT_0004583497 /DNA_START=260 /DNA_END=526 /DNA_ORIENTATION=+